MAHLSQSLTVHSRSRTRQIAQCLCVTSSDSEMEGGDIGKTMDGQTPDELRVSMVKMFLNDLVRGVRALGQV
ncbi:hypothetical protein CsSME_00033145 [Camellia sinensis var. sinensis]